MYKSELPNVEHPRYPLLSTYEVDKHTDLRARVPHIASRLRPSERIVDIVPVDFAHIEKHPSAVRAMMKLAGVERSYDIGINGPAVASRSNPENELIPSLNKYEDLFGRDSLRTASYVSDRYPQLMKSTLLELAKYQGLDNEPVPSESAVPFGQEQFGKIPHHVKDPNDPVARKFSVMQGWRWPFYGSIDATPLFLNESYKLSQNDPGLLQHPYTDKSGQEQVLATAVRRGLIWLQEELTKSGAEGLLWYKDRDTRKLSFGMMNQGWRDSALAYRHRNGEAANTTNGIAPIEVQATVYDVLLAAASREINPRTRQEIVNTANTLRDTFLEKMWVDDSDGGFFAVGADRDAKSSVRPIQVVSSSIGHLLNSSILEGDDPETSHKRELTIRRLFADGLLSPHGIRTISRYEQTFYEGGYHNGSVWIWDTYEIACGLQRHGYYGLAHELEKRIYNVIESTGRFPEFVRGGDTENPEFNTKEIYVVDDQADLLYLYEQPPQEIQAWTVASMLGIKHRHRKELAKLDKPEQRAPKAAINPSKRKLENTLLSRLQPTE